MGIDRKRIGFSLVLVLLIALALEGALSGLARVSPRVHALLASPWESYTVPDARLGHRPNPDFPGHDARGFRNPRVPGKADIVVLGDSQTYGTGVEMTQAWPSRLSELTGKTVYNMAFGGYAPAHALYYWDEAAAFHPDLVIGAVYAGNDYFDDFDLVYNRGQLVELGTPAPAVRKTVRDAERALPLAEYVGKMFVMGDDVPASQGWTLQAAGAAPVEWLTCHSRLYALARRARYVWESRGRSETAKPGNSWERAVAFAHEHPDFCQPFDGGGAHTLFTSRYRLAALDQSDPRIREGLWITLRALARAHELADASGIRFLVVLIPTKESVFETIAGDQPDSYRRLVENEALARRATTAFLEERRIEHVDALAALRARLAAGPQPYALDHDGHPNEHGHRAIAEAVARRLDSEE